MQSLELVVNGNKLVADVARIFDARKIIEHRLDLRLARDQDAAFRRSWFVGHGGKSLKKLGLSPQQKRNGICRNRGCFGGEDGQAVTGTW